MCWACVVSVVLQIHAHAEIHAHSAAGPSPDANNGHLPRPRARPIRACTRIVPQLNSPSHDAAAYIRDCIGRIIEHRPLTSGLVCHFAPCAQLARVPCGYGGLVGAPFEYRTGNKAQVYLVAPAARFVERDHGSLTTHDETQLRAYYRSISDMQHPMPVFGRTFLSRRFGPPPPPTPPPRGVPSPAVEMTPGRNIPPISRTLHSGDASLLQQYHRTSLIVSSRYAVNPTRGGGANGSAHIEPRKRWFLSRQRRVSGCVQAHCAYGTPRQEPDRAMHTTVR